MPKGSQSRYRSRLLWLAFAESARRAAGTFSADDENAVLITGGSFVMGGTNKQLELLKENVEVNSFYIDKTAVTNAAFRQFVRATKFKTESETFGWSFVLENDATEKARETSQGSPEGAPQWLAVPQAYWRKPNGPGSGIKNHLDYPAVHVSYNDAKAYCKWKDMRLPTETEWEYAARGGLDQKEYPWGDKLMGDSGTWHMNIWQGDFPKNNEADDGFVSLCPADAFEPNGYGLYNMLGNVWEWVATKYDRDQSQRVLRGGSYIDSADGKFNHATTTNTRMGNSPDSASTNTGFRCARSLNSRVSRSGTGYKYSKSTAQPQQQQQKRQGGAPAGMDQELMQKIAAEGGVEALQEYISKMGMNANVFTPAQLKERQAQLKKQMADLEAQKEL